MGGWVGGWVGDSPWPCPARARRPGGPTWPGPAPTSRGASPCPCHALARWVGSPQRTSSSWWCSWWGGGRRRRRKGGGRLMWRRPRGGGGGLRRLSFVSSSWSWRAVVVVSRWVGCVLWPGPFVYRLHACVLCHVSAGAGGVRGVGASSNALARTRQPHHSYHIHSPCVQIGILSTQKKHTAHKPHNHQWTRTRTRQCHLKQQQPTQQTAKIVSRAARQCSSLPHPLESSSSIQPAHGPHTVE